MILPMGRLQISSEPEVQADPNRWGIWYGSPLPEASITGIPNCGNMNPDNATEMTRAQAEAAGYEACKKCY